MGIVKTREVGVPSAVNEYVVRDCARMRDGAEKAKPKRVIVKNILYELGKTSETIDLCEMWRRLVEGQCNYVVHARWLANGGPSLPNPSGGGDATTW